MSEIVVVGAGPVGLIAALLLARRGHHVIVCERDSDPTPLDLEDVWRSWQRPGVSQLRQSHMLLPRGRQILRDQLPDVLDSLVALGCLDVDVFTPPPDGSTDPGDSDHRVIVARRPIFEGIIHRVAANEPGVDFRLNATVASLEYVSRTNGSPPVVTGVRTRLGDTIRADLVVDARGRQAISSNWVAEISGRAPIVASEPCNVVPYTRFFRWQPGCSLPPCPRPLGPVVDLGFANMVFNLADNRTFAVVVGIAAGDAELKDLRREAAFMAAVRSAEPFAPLLEPDVSTPISSVAPMGGLENRSWEYLVAGAPPVVGYQPIGDVLLHTNPIYGYGMSLGAVHALLLANALGDYSNDLYGLAVALNSNLQTLNRDWYNVSVAGDQARTRRWRGDTSPVDPNSFPELMRTVLAPAMKVDGEISRAVSRIYGLLDRPTAIYDRPDLLERARTIAAANPLPSAPTPAPDRARLLEIMAAASNMPVAAGAGA